MKGIILAGGRGTRLNPLTNSTSKHLLPIGNEPMIYYPIKKLVEAGVTEIMIVLGKEEGCNTVAVLGSGNDLGCSLTYKVQDNPDGIGGALKLCRNFVGHSNCVVLLVDNIFKDNLEGYVKEFDQPDSSQCRLFFKEVHNPTMYGVGKFEGNCLVSIEEKPQTPASNFACVGIYFYTHHVFDAIDRTEPSARGEYEITSINNLFIEDGTCEWEILSNEWADVGTMDTYHTTNWDIYNDFSNSNS